MTKCMAPARTKNGPARRRMKFTARNLSKSPELPITTVRTRGQGARTQFSSLSWAGRLFSERAGSPANPRAMPASTHRPRGSSRRPAGPGRHRRRHIPVRAHDDNAPMPDNSAGLVYGTILVATLLSAESAVQGTYAKTVLGVIVALVTYWLALAYARFTGKRLEQETKATVGG